MHIKGQFLYDLEVFGVWHVTNFDLSLLTAEMSKNQSVNQRILNWFDGGHSFPCQTSNTTNKLTTELKILVPVGGKVQKRPYDTYSCMILTSAALHPLRFFPSLPLMPVNMSRKAGMTSQHEQTVTLDTSAGALAGIKRFEQKSSNICEQKNKPPSFGSDANQPAWW